MEGHKAVEGLCDSRIPDFGFVFRIPKNPKPLNPNVRRNPEVRDLGGRFYGRWFEGQAGLHYLNVPTSLFGILVEVPHFLKLPYLT